ncbi:nucleotidyltransferase [Bacillus sp. AFS088145]|uniref:nucleotidyltransferase domain-containing protein n=1 Tax=Bacillus sp. AFS088145 TaxID=2033514 RepID=UPI000BF87261|nr:nucleotidyltransferase [Bacillus sp. AFS088145]PFH91383.1 nucleotidyltransferase [Bacillus sp. AFS088145]
MKIEKEAILKSLVEQLDLPDSAYEKAKKRYEDLGEWFNRDDSLLKNNEVHIFPQGSFLLGTALRPVNKEEEYDLDLACKLRSGVNNFTHTQKAIKELVGKELEAYRTARGIKENLASKHRCWRLEYHDSISFHLDIVPAIPADDIQKSMLFEAINKNGTSEFIADKASNSAMLITDDRDPNYNDIVSNWNISNPTGYGIWFTDRMNIFEGRALYEKALISEIPNYERKTPLQRCIQLLKRHRDIMFGDNESKPISIIITTLAAKAYSGETNIYTALNNILEKMPRLIYPRTPRVPNPVNPEEDFADRWEMPEYKHLKLEQNFNIWLQQAKLDFNVTTSITDPILLNENFNKKYSVSVGQEELNKNLGLVGMNIGSSNINKPKMHNIHDPARPWKI